MTEITDTTITQIKSLLESCVEEARRQGWDGERYDYTAQDLQWVTDELGRKPTAAEWAGAGLNAVGSAHVG